MRLFSLLCCCLLMLVGCGRPQGEAAGPAERFALTGTVVRLDTSNQIALIKHDTIRGEGGKVWMEAMTMEFPVPDATEFGKLRQGARIRATVMSRPKAIEYWLTEIQPEP
jgi:Cu/Ag efflux protein CusF